jgi:tRNA(fMet)-specific endonuclease VapC
MAGYILDTDTCSYIMKRSHPKLLKKLQRVPIGALAVSVVTMAELLYGAKLSSKPKLAIEAYEAFIRHLAVLDWTQEAAEHYADIRADLKKRGEMIGANDLLIAAHARSVKSVLVTNNVREFGRVKGLKVENWAA